MREFLEDLNEFEALGVGLILVVGGTKSQEVIIL